MDIKEVARLANVSVSTVSRFINGGYVSNKNKEIIKRIIEETGFIPDRGAIMLRTKKTRQIGVIVPRVISSSVSKMIKGISNVLSANNYCLVLADTFEKFDLEVNYLNLFKDDYVDGIILIGTVFSSEHEEVFKRINIPFVILAQPHKEYTSISYDDYLAAKEMTMVLVKNRNVPAILSARSDDYAVGHLRTKGYFDALNELGLSSNSLLNLKTNLDINDSYEKTKQLFSIDPNIDCIFCSTELMACGATKYIKEIGKRIPEDVAIATVGNGYLSNIVTPTITCAEFLYENAGEKAASVIIDKIASKPVNHEYKFGFNVILRQSTN